MGILIAYYSVKYLYVCFFKNIEVYQVWDPEKIMMVFDHQVPRSSLNLTMNYGIML